MSLSHWNQTLWPVYITIKILDAIIQQFRKCPRMLLVGSIPIIHKGLEDANNKDKDRKAKIYHIALKTILQRTYPSFPSIDFKKIRY